MSGVSDLRRGRQERLATARLYAILDLDYASRRTDRSPLELARALLRGGADILQLRAKSGDANALLPLAADLRVACHEYGALFIVNDHPALARESQADGVHVGQGDLPVETARLQAGPDCLVGKSTHAIEQALAAEAEGAEYIGVGPLYATPTKPDYVPVGLGLILQVSSRVTVPQFCIGGVNSATVRAVVEAGATRIVCVSALLMAPDPELETRVVKAAFQAHRAVAEGVLSGGIRNTE